MSVKSQIETLISGNQLGHSAALWS